MPKREKGPSLHNSKAKTAISLEQTISYQTLPNSEDHGQKHISGKLRELSDVISPGPTLGSAPPVADPIVPISNLPEQSQIPDGIPDEYKPAKILARSTTAIASAPSANRSSSYEPLSSVWEGSDGDLIEAMLKFYATITPEPILDATFNAGRFWKGSSRKVVSMDIDPQHKPMIVGDNRRMKGVKAASFGTVIYDPPHVGPQGRDKSKKRFDVDFGATIECGKKHNWNLSYLYPPFLKQAKRVLKPNGLLLAKITDMVNNHKSKWPHCDFMRMAEEAGFIVCDLIIKVRNGPMISNKWKEAHHARKRHCFWIVCRKSDNCEREIKGSSSAFRKSVQTC